MSAVGHRHPRSTAEIAAKSRSFSARRADGDADITIVEADEVGGVADQDATLGKAGRELEEPSCA